MANETTNEFTSALNNLVDTLGKLGQQQVELITSGINSVAGVFEPLAKTATEPR